MKVTGREMVEFFSQTKHSASGCLEWLGAVSSSNGYPLFTFQGKTVYAHRWSLAVSLGRDIAPGMMALHACNNRACVRHVYEGDARQNARDRIAAGTHARQRLSVNDVQEIRRAYRKARRARRNGDVPMSQEDLARIFSCSRSAVKHVVNGTTWEVA